MPITEAIHSQGAFSIQLANMPSDLRDSIRDYGRVIVRRMPPSTLVGVDAAGARAEADFVGVLTRHRISFDGMQLTGLGLPALLSDDQSHQADGYYALLGSQKLSRFVAYIVEGTGGDPDNLPTTGLTVGTVHAPYADQTLAFQWAPSRMTARDALTYYCSSLGCEWRVKTDGTVHVGSVDDLYGAPTKLVASQPWPGSTDADTFVMRGLSVEYDSSQWASGVAMQDPDTNVTLSWASNADATLIGIDGTPVRRIRYFDRPGDIPDDATQAQLDAWCAARLAELQTPRRIISVDGIRSAAVYDVGSGTTVGLVCGEWVWVWAPGVCPIDSTTRVMIGGQTLTPIAVRVASLETSLSAGMGVLYEYPDGAGTLVDLTPYVVWESTNNTVSVG